MSRAKQDHAAAAGEDLSLAKISIPQLKDPLHRRHLYRRLDEARQGHSVVWISAPAGAGKTYLLASYLAERRCARLWYQLDAGDGDFSSFVYHFGIAAQQAGVLRRPLPVMTPEYSAGRAIFARNFFREAYGRLGNSGVVVLENYQDAPAGSVLDELLSAAVSELPRDLTLIVLSRGEVPPVLARERVHGGLVVFEEKDLRLHHREILALARRYNLGELDGRRVRELYAQSHGWFAGVVLLLARGKTSIEHGTPLGDREREVVFDYFASELFDGLDRATREFLMRTAFLSPMTVGSAQALTGCEDAEARLEWLVRNHYFVVRISGDVPAYRYHPLFEAFLRASARRAWSSAELVGVARRAAEHAAESGRIDDAVALLLVSDARESLGDLLLRAAPDLLAQGRHRSLERWLGHVPSERLDRDAWLRYWFAMARLYSDPLGARESFVRAYERFHEEQSAHGVYAAWIGIIDSLLVGMDDFQVLDHWLLEFERVRARFPEFPSERIESQASVAVLCAKVHRCERYGDIEQWADYALSAARRTNDLSARIQVHFYRGYYDLMLRAESPAVDAFRTLARDESVRSLSPIDRLRIQLFLALYWNCRLDHAQSRQAVEEGLRIAEASGVLVLNVMLLCQLACQCLLAHDAEAADEALAQMARHVESLASPWDHAAYSNLDAARRRLEGDLAGAASARRSNLREIERLGESISTNFSRFQAALVAVEEQRLEDARTYLEPVRRFARARNAVHLRQGCHFVDALIALEEGDPERANGNLREGFSLPTAGTPYGFILWPPGMLTRLCETALHNGIEGDAVAQFIRAYGLVPTASSVDLDEWPWPVRIYTMGEFRVVHEGEALASRGKAQKRPLELLRMLIAFGGRGVGVGRLCEALWPDAEGDAAARAFKPTLHRLRRLLGEQALALSDGRLSLDDRHCWVDVWPLERRIEEVERAASDPGRDLGRLEASVDEALRLYRGPFLGQGSDPPWALPMRERLRGKLLIAIQKAVQRLGASNDCRRVRSLFEKGLEVDACNEQMYRGLMACHAANDDRGAALSVYARCRRVLASALDLGPGEATERLRRQIEAADRHARSPCPTCGRRL